MPSIFRIFWKSPAPITFDDDFNTRMKQIHSLKKALEKFIGVYETFLKKTERDDEPHRKLAGQLNDYATTIDGELSQQLIQSAAEIKELGTHYMAFNQAAKQQILDKLKHWCRARDGGYRQLKREVDALKQAQDKLNVAMKRAKVKDLQEAGENEDTQALKEDYEEKLLRVEQHLQSCYNSMNYELAYALMTLVTLVRDLSKKCAATVDEETMPPTF